MRMVDLFSGIGGFSLAASWVWGDELEIACFCEQDKFCQRVLRKHWPSVPIVEDVNDLERIVAYAERERCFTSKPITGNISSIIGEPISENSGRKKEVDLLTGGFPCQPASCAGKRKGTEDSRWLWPQTLAVIRAIEPEWCLLENVPGLLTIESGLLFETVCTDLEDAGYEVQPLIIPAAGVGAPHRRDRVWIIAYSQQSGARRERGSSRNEVRRTGKGGKEGIRQGNGETCSSGFDTADRHASDSIGFNDDSERHGTGEICREWREETEVCGCNAPDSDQPRPQEREMQPGDSGAQFKTFERSPWDEHWYEALTRIHAFHDGIPGRLVVSRQQKGWRANALKAAGNSIAVPVAAEIMKAIKFACVPFVPDCRDCPGTVRTLREGAHTKKRGFEFYAPGNRSG